jgi:hypothetical protein
LTDWPQIVGLYDALLRTEPSPVVALNRAVAVAMRDGPEAGLALIAAAAAAAARLPPGPGCDGRPVPPCRPASRPLASTAAPLPHSRSGSPSAAFCCGAWPNWAAEEKFVIAVEIRKSHSTTPCRQIENP